ncbi:MAG: high-potential iron-sulfur protein [Gammaproteobacteria bacterium]
MPTRRRDFLQRAAQLIAIAAATPTPAARARAESACTTPESESLRVSLHYADPSPHADKRCGDCAFYTAGPQGDGCGSCEMLSGDTVNASAWCDSWSPRG